MKILSQILLIQSFLFSTLDAQLEIPQDDPSLLRAKYHILDDGVSLGVEVAPRKVYFTGHGGEIEIRRAVESYNHGKKRGNTILITGDRPVFGMMRVYPEPSNNPDRIKMGDGRFRITYKDQSIWLEDFEEIHTEFHPSYTEYKLRTSHIPGLSLRLTISQADDWGCLVLLEGRVHPGSGKVRVDFHYGGLLRTGNRQSANYFNYDPEDGRTNTLTIEDNYCILDGQEQKVFDQVMIVPGQPCQMSDRKGKVMISQDMEPGAGSNLLSFVIGHAENLPELKSTFLEAKPQRLYETALDYYKSMIDSYSISTPCRYLDAGFRNAIVNFDYAWGGIAWLEGVHWWYTPWTNLFQTSAGIALDQLERTRTTMQTFNVEGMGPAPVLNAMGSATYGDQMITEDGLMYYCYQIWQYYEHTGDATFVLSIWPDLVRSIERMYERRDPDGDGLLSWREGCNPFLYQADHLGIPNGGASPSLIAAGMIRQMASMGEILGETEDAGILNDLAERTNLHLLRLWNRQKGCFYNHIDHQDVKHMVHYYTDLVFPALYAGLEDEYCWQSLNYLRNTLLLDAKLYQPDLDLQLCRVGDFQPFLFSTCNVMPTQMAETARALFKTGDVDMAYELMKSVAVTGTIYTEAPGNFPEAMGLKGKGEGQFIFGNPIGSFLYTLVDGLFGLRLADGGNTLSWSPAFPFDWPEAELNMPYADITYKSSSNSSGKKLEYHAQYACPRELSFSSWLKPGMIKEVWVNGKPGDYRIEPGLNAMKIILDAGSSNSHHLEIIYEETEVSVKGPALTFTREVGRHSFSHELSRISDPQGLFGKISVNGKTLQYTSGDKPGNYTAFAYLKDIPVALPLNMEIKPRYEVQPDTALYQIESNLIRLPIRFRAAAGVETEISILGQSVRKNWQQTGVQEETDTIILPVQKKMAEGNYGIRITMKQNDRFVLDSLFNVNLRGPNPLSTDQMASLRDESTRHIDLSRLYNAENPSVWGPWNMNDSTIVLSCLQDENGIMHTPSGKFRFPSEGPHFMIVQAGESDKYTQLPHPVAYPEKTMVSVSEEGYMLSLFYHSEVKYRHTFEKVGSLTLNYVDGTDQIIPLVVTGNMKAVYKHSASETIPVIPCRVPREGMTLNILRIGLENKALGSFTIHMPIVDAQFALVAASISSLENK